METYLQYERSGCLYKVTNGEREEIPLRPQERRLVERMDEENRRRGYRPAICSYQQLIAHLWGGPRRDGKKYLQRLVHDIRKKLGAEGPELLRNETGEGYVLETRPWHTDGRAGFICGPPVTDPARFHGRVEEVRRIVGIWRSRPLQHVAVTGPARSGKTSLLHFLRALHEADPALLREEHRGLRPEQARDFRFVYVDFHNPVLTRRGHLLAHILGQLGVPATGPVDLVGFCEAVRREVDRPVVILLDELQAGLASPELDAEFWRALRSLSSHGASDLIGFVVATSSRPGELDPGDAGVSSLLDIIGHRVFLGPLQDGEARGFLATFPQPLPMHDREWMLESTRRWPALLQLCCNERLLSLRHGESGDTWKERTFRALEPHAHLLDR